MPSKILTLAFLAALLLSGCDTKMEPENAQTLKLEMKKGSGTVSGILKAGTPGMAGISSKNFDFQAPGHFEVVGGPSEYTLTFNSLTSEMQRGWTLSVDGRELKRGADMVVEDDKGPRVTFQVGRKKSDEEKG